MSGFFALPAMTDHISAAAVMGIFRTIMQNGAKYLPRSNK